MPNTVNWKFVKNLNASYVVDNMRFAIRERLGAKLLYLSAISLLVTVALLAYLGPFGTWASLTVSERLLFWGSTVGTNWIVGHIAFSAMSRTVRVWGWPAWTGFVLAALAAALPGTGTVWLAVIFYLDYRPSSVTDIALLYAQVTVLHLIIGSLAFHFIFRTLQRGGASEEELLHLDECAEGGVPQATPEPALLDRLSARSRGELLHLRMQDHYVEVHTAAGSEMLLLRFRDALSEVQGVDGLQVHRSHWVARKAVAGVERRGGGRITLRLVNGSRVPVSRSFAPLLKSRGWI